MWKAYEQETLNSKWKNLQPEKQFEEGVAGTKQ
jgi:hypothetical protein